MKQILCALFVSALICSPLMAAPPKPTQPNDLKTNCWQDKTENFRDVTVDVRNCASSLIFGIGCPDEFPEAKRIFDIAELCRKKGDFAMAYACYHETCRMVPGSDYAKKSAQFIAQIEQFQNTGDAELSEPNSFVSVAPVAGVPFFCPLLEPISKEPSYFCTLECSKSCCESCEGQCPFGFANLLQSIESFFSDHWVETIPCQKTKLIAPLIRHASVFQSNCCPCHEFEECEPANHPVKKSEVKESLNWHQVTNGADIDLDVNSNGAHWLRLRASLQFQNLSIRIEIEPCRHFGNDTRVSVDVERN